MKITKEQLKRIIKEEFENLIDEGNDWYSDEYETLADKKFADSQRDMGHELNKNPSPTSDGGTEVIEPEKVESEWQNILNWLKKEWENRHNSRSEEREELAAMGQMMMRDIKKVFSKTIRQESKDVFSVGALENPLSTIDVDQPNRPMGGYATDDGIYGAMTVLAPLVDWYPNAKVAMDALQKLMKELHS